MLRKDSRRFSGKGWEYYGTVRPRGPGGPPGPPELASRPEPKPLVAGVAEGLRKVGELEPPARHLPSEQETSYTL